MTATHDSTVRKNDPCTVEGITEWCRTRIWGEPVSMNHEIGEKMTIFGCDSEGHPVTVDYLRYIEYEQEFPAPTVTRLENDYFKKYLKEVYDKKLITKKDYCYCISRLNGEWSDYYKPKRKEDMTEYWNKEVDKANRKRNDDPKLWEKISGASIIRRIPIQSVPDYGFPDDRNMDWDTYIYIYVDEDKVYFTLETSHPSEWDAFPVITGGQISYADFKRYMKKLNNHDYDGLKVGLFRRLSNRRDFF